MTFRWRADDDPRYHVYWGYNYSLLFSNLESFFHLRNKLNFSSVLQDSLSLHETRCVHDSMNRSKLNLQNVLFYKCRVVGRVLNRSVREGMKDMSNVKVHLTDLT